MKKTIATTALVLAFAGLAGATTTVGLNNFNFPNTAENGITIVDNAGNPLSNVNFGIGTFSGAVASDAAGIRAGFSELGNGSTQAIHFAFATDANNSASTDASPEDGSPIYVVFYGNADGSAAADLASAADYIVFEGNANYIVENPVLGATVQVDLQRSMIAYGTEVESNNNGVVGPFTAFTNGVTFGAIPEPSSALLSLVGLAFVARRRR